MSRSSRDGAGRSVRSPTSAVGPGATQLGIRTTSSFTLDAHSARVGLPAITRLADEPPGRPWVPSARASGAVPLAPVLVQRVVEIEDRELGRLEEPPLEAATAQRGRFAMEEQAGWPAERHSSKSSLRGEDGARVADQVRGARVAMGHVAARDDRSAHPFEPAVNPHPRARAGTAVRRDDVMHRGRVSAYATTTSERRPAAAPGSRSVSGRR